MLGVISRFVLFLAFAPLLAACGEDSRVVPHSGDSSTADGSALRDATVDTEAERPEPHVTALDVPATDEGADADGGSDATDASLLDADRVGDGAVDALDGSGVVEAIHYYGRWNRLAGRAITVNTG